MVELSVSEKKKLQRLIDASVKAHNEQYDRQRSLNKYAEELWGFAPSDRDLDNIIDGCLGGCGRSSGFDVEEFIADMNGAMD